MPDAVATAPHEASFGARASRHQRRFISFDVDQFRTSSFFRFSDLHGMPFDQSGDVAVGVVEVAANDRLFGTDNDTTRLQADFQPVRAEVALGRRVADRVDVQRIVGARLHARLAPDATIRVEIDDSIIATVQRGDRTDRHTRRVVAMIAPHHAEQSAVVGELAFLHIFHPRAIDADRHFVFALASDRTGVAANALAVVDQETKSRHCHLT